MAELARLFLRLGVTAFGGPAAHIAMMHDEVVLRRGWVSNDRFVDLVGATNLIPGPNSTELAIHLGWDRARGRGLVVAGVCFILPAAVIVGFLAWVYVTYGDTPALEGVLYGIKPVVIAIVVQALIKLVPAVAKTALLGLLAAAALAVYLAGVNELVVLVAGGAGAGLHVARSAPPACRCRGPSRWRRWRRRGATWGSGGCSGCSSGSAPSSTAAATCCSPSCRASSSTASAGSPASSSSTPSPSAR